MRHALLRHTTQYTWIRTYVCTCRCFSTICNTVIDAVCSPSIGTDVEVHLGVLCYGVVISVESQTHVRHGFWKNTCTHVLPHSENTAMHHPHSPLHTWHCSSYTDSYRLAARTEKVGTHHVRYHALDIFYIHELNSMEILYRETDLHFLVKDGAITYIVHVGKYTAGKFLTSIIC